MIRILHRSMSVLVCILLMNFVSFAQEKETSKTPTTVLTEQPKKPITKEQNPTTLIINKKDDGATGDAGDGKNDGDPKDKGQDNLVTSNIASSTSASPEASLTNNLQDIPINLYTGTPIIGYPIVTLKEVDVTVPISLSYNATGMKANDVASWCGMNWTLSAGGFLSRIVRGVPDEGRLDITNLNLETAVARKGFFKYGANVSAANNVDDGEPDWFFLNVGGASYKFMLEAFTGKARFFPDADIDVKVTFTNRPDGQSIVGKFSNWIFKMPNGMIYEFSGAAGTTESSFEAEANFDFNGHINFYRNTNLLTSGWYLTKIKGSYGHPVTFTYKESAYNYFKLSDQYTSFNGGGGHCPSLAQVENKKINQVNIEGATPSKIEGSTLEVIFNPCDTTICYDVYDPGSDGTIQICDSSSCIQDRKDISGPNYNTYGTTLKLLQSILIRDKLNTSAIPVKYRFEYEYLGQGSTNEVIPYGYTLGTTAPYHWEKRLFLKRIIMPDTNIFHRFHYKGAGTKFPSRLTRGIDHWGFFNDKAINDHLIGTDQYTPSGCTTDANRKANVYNFTNEPEVGGSYFVSQNSLLGTLEQIDYSLGATTKFYYDSHNATNFNEFVGGARVRAIRYQDKISGITQIKKYEYTNDDGFASGFLFFKPLYRFTDLSGTPVSSSSLYGQLLSESSKPAVGYSQVKEILCDSIGTPGLGYTVKNYSQDERDPIVAYNMFRPLTGGAFYLSPSKYTPDHDYFGGTERSTRVYNQAGQLLMRKTQEYQKILDGKSILSLKKVFSSGTSYDANQTYNLNTFKFRMVGDSTFIYDQNGANPIINWSNQSYGTKHNQAIKSATQDGRGNLLETYTRFVADLDFGSDSTQFCQRYDEVTGECLEYGYDYTPHIPTGSFAKGIYQLKKRNILHGIVESYTKQAGATIKSSLNRYYADSTGDHKAGLLHENYVLENVPSTTFNFTTFNRTTDELVKSADYGEPRSRMEFYTSNGQVIKSKVIHGAKGFTIYDSQEVLPITIIKNFSEGDGVQVAGELWTSYEYNNHVFGASKETMPNGLEVRTEYYPDGKTLCIKDKDGYIVKHFEYLFRGKSSLLSTPNLTTDTTYNRVITRTPRGKYTSVSSLDYTDCMISIAQMDGSGRTLQSIGFRASPTGKDIITGTTYDKFGRSKYNILPVGTNQITGKFVNNHLSLAKTFYGDDYPYTEVTEYEASPMGRVFKSYGTGKAWRDNNKSTQMSYLSEGLNIRKFNILPNGDVESIYTYGNYPGYSGTGNELSVNIMTDERGSIVKEYTDKSGNVIQKSVQVDDDGNYLNSGFVYDNYGKIKYILPPKAFGQTLFNETK